MSQPDFENLPTRLGVYTLTELLGRHSITELYLATQSHVERGVVVQVLRPGSDKHTVDFFLQMGRAKSAAELPHVSHVLESMMSGNIWFLTHEQPEGTSLVQMARAGKHLSTAQACKIIAAASELYAAAQDKNVCMGFLRADSIFVHGEEVRFLSPALPGESSPEQLPEQMKALANALEAVLPQNEAGQTRVATLVNWIRDGYEGSYLDWVSTGATASGILEQTAPLLTREEVSGFSSRTVALRVEHKRARRKLHRTIRRCIVAALCVLAAGGLGICLAPGSAESLPMVEGGYVYCAAGKKAVRVAARPVSIREYGIFLRDYSDPGLGVTRRNNINRGIPAEFAAHTPAGWQEQLMAVDNGSRWQGEKITADSPVRGVSYWDALAYANYAGAQLPDAPLLEAVWALAEPNGLAEEWTTTTTEADCVYEAGRIVLYARSTHPVCETTDSARCLRRGFRVVFPVQKTTD